VQTLLQSGVLIDLALALTALECLGLAWLHKRERVSMPLGAIAGQLLAGVMLLLALRCALKGADYRWTLLFFSASLPAHLYDLRLRARSRS
jgi:hypothetical protein